MVARSKTMGEIICNFVGAGWEETSWQIRSAGSGCTILRSCTVGDALAATPPGDALLPELELVDGAF